MNSQQKCECRFPWFSINVMSATVHCILSYAYVVKIIAVEFRDVLPLFILYTLLASFTEVKYLPKQSFYVNSKFDKLLSEIDNALQTRRV